MLTKLYYILNLKKLLQVGILTFYRASVSSPFNRSPWLDLFKVPAAAAAMHLRGQHDVAQVTYLHNLKELIGVKCNNGVLSLSL
jgi:hypothetical protein